MTIDDTLEAIDELKRTLARVEEENKRFRAENDKLQKRVENLRECLQQVRQCGLDGYAAGTADSHSLQLGIATGSADRTLAKDDEAANA